MPSAEEIRRLKPVELFALLFVSPVCLFCAAVNLVPSTSAGSSQISRSSNGTLLSISWMCAATSKTEPLLLVLSLRRIAMLCHSWAMWTTLRA